MSHHDLQSCQLDRLNHCYLCVATAAFFNKIDPERTSSDEIWQALTENFERSNVFARLPDEQYFMAPYSLKLTPGQL